MTRNIWAAALCCLAGVVFSPCPALAADSGASSADRQSLLTVGKDDRVLGNPDAPITIIEYASMTCPHCAHFANGVLPELKKKWIDTGKVKWVLRDFPLDGEAVHASMIARCAPPDRFYAFVDTFFADQDKWAAAPDHQAALTRLAALGGMGKAEVDKCLANNALEDQILNSRLVATNQLEVNATPTFFVNGAKFAGEATVKEFSASLETAFAKLATAQATPTPSQEKPATAQVSPAPTQEKPAAAQAPPAATQEKLAAAQPSPTTAQTNPVDAGSSPATTIWGRLQAWFLSLFGGHS
jgi:protein-disulfide isomerase